MAKVENVVGYETVLDYHGLTIQLPHHVRLSDRIRGNAIVCYNGLPLAYFTASAGEHAIQPGGLYQVLTQVHNELAIYDLSVRNPSCDPVVYKAALNASREAMKLYGYEPKNSMEVKYLSIPKSNVSDCLGRSDLGPFGLHGTLRVFTTLSQGAKPNRPICIRRTLTVVKNSFQQTFDNTPLFDALNELTVKKYVNVGEAIPTNTELWNENRALIEAFLLNM